MPIPEFNEIKAPALQLFMDGRTRKLSEIAGELAKHFNLTADELEELLPSGTERRWQNRAGWACYDLYRAGLFDRPKRGFYVINEAGRQLGAQKPKVIDRDFLLQFPSFVQFIRSTGEKKSPKFGEKTGNEESIILNKNQTPEELIDNAYEQIHAALCREVLDLVSKMNPYDFERLVIDLLVAMGYGGSRKEAARVTKMSGDEGIDGLINEDRLGLDVIYVQAKRWQASVGRPEIQNFVGALSGKNAHKGIFITTSGFANTAIDYARVVKEKIILIDGERLVSLMIEHNIGVTPYRSFEIKRADSDYFDQN